MKKQIHVAKFGSSLIADTERGIFQDKINNYVARVITQNPDDAHIFVVSGARAAGIHQVSQLSGVADRITDKQLAGIGATEVFSVFERACAKQGMLSASFPITHHLLSDDAGPETSKERESFVTVLKRNADIGIVSIINEADAMNDKELMRLLFGFEYEIDNDLLAAHIARAVSAKSLTLWKKEGGLRDDAGDYISQITDDTLSQYRGMLAQRTKSKTGRGGPATTLDALELAARSGVNACVAGVNEDMTGVNETRLVIG